MIFEIKKVIKYNSDKRKNKLFFYYRRTWWWHFIHYNYFHRILFKELYPRKPKLKNRNYELYKKLDNLITLRNVGFIRRFVWKHTR